MMDSGKKDKQQDRIIHVQQEQSKLTAAEIKKQQEDADALFRRLKTGRKSLQGAGNPGTGFATPQSLMKTAQNTIFSKLGSV